ncbi:SPRY domain-containing protein 3 [Halotydeus destructor]|nr:SPRY domain-containing protein 3 [Halotydeus destructor]
MLKSLTDLSSDSIKKAVSSALGKMDGYVFRRLPPPSADPLASFQRRANMYGLHEPPFNQMPEPNLPPYVQMRNRPNMFNKKPQSERIVVSSEDILSYGPEEKDLPGVHISAESLRVKQDSCDYFEVEILDPGLLCEIAIGVVPWNHPLDQLPGYSAGSVGYHAGDGRVYLGHQRGDVVGNKCIAGDKIGCGVRIEKSLGGQRNRMKIENVFSSMPNLKLRVFFTFNGNEIASASLSPLLLRGGLYPALALGSPGEEVKLSLNASFVQTVPKSMSDDSLMCIDSNEDEWSRLADVSLNDSCLEYTGRGKSIIDVGLAQARKPLTPRNHYFEIEIVDPGENCYIAIGLTKKEYPYQSHPGWHKGSIAYHADDGKLFLGSGAGDPFGPRCHKGDVMGVGIMFPTESREKSKKQENNCDDAEELHNQASSSDDKSVSEISSGWSESDSDASEENDDRPYAINDWPLPEEIRFEAMARGQMEFVPIPRQRPPRGYSPVRGARPNSKSPKVEVFFTRNGVIVGKRQVYIPKGGFHPAIGMLSCGEKVKVDLNPLSG